MGFIGKYCEGSYGPTPNLTFGLSPGDLGEDWKKKRQIKRKCRKEGSFAFIAFSRNQVSAHPHHGCACAGCLKYNYTPQCGLVGLHSPPSVTFIAKLLCFQVNIMGLQLRLCQALIDPWCGINENTASLILSVVLGERWQAISHPFCSGGRKAKQTAHFKSVPSLLDISIWISRWFVKLNLPQIELSSLPFFKIHHSSWALCLG